MVTTKSDFCFWVLFIDPFQNANDRGDNTQIIAKM